MLLVLQVWVVLTVALGLVLLLVLGVQGVARLVRQGSRAAAAPRRRTSATSVATSG